MKLDLTPSCPLTTNAALEKSTFSRTQFLHLSLSTLVPNRVNVQAVAYTDRQKAGGGRKRQWGNMV